MRRAVLFLMGMMLSFALGMSAMTMMAAASSRDVLLEDLRIGNVEDDIHHRAERPGKVVRAVHWVDADGHPSIVVVTELGWVYQSGDTPGEWTLVARILEDAGPR